MDAPRSEVLAAMALRMNRLPEVVWDRCALHQSNGVVYGWVDRPDCHADFVALDFSWGETEGLDGKPLEWLSVVLTTSSARYSRAFDRRLRGTDEGHADCERIEHTFGELVSRKVEL